MEFIYQPESGIRLGDILIKNLREASWQEFRAAIAFVKRSGTRHIKDDLAAFSKTRKVELIVGIDHQGTSREGLEDLLQATQPKGRVVVFHNPASSTFHPKLYLFKGPECAEVIIGSGNLTEGGLFTNYEAGIRFRLNMADKQDVAQLANIEKNLDAWSQATAVKNAVVLNTAILQQLVESKDVPAEAFTKPSKPASAGTGAVSGKPALFSPTAVPKAPAAAPSKGKAGLPQASAAKSPFAKAGPAVAVHLLQAGGGVPDGFAMTLQQTDVGHGQKTAGATARSPEVFIPLVARNARPGFWKWPDGYTVNKTKSGNIKYDRPGIRMQMENGQTIIVNSMGWEQKGDLRFRHQALRNAGNVGDILALEQAAPGSGLDYYVRVVAQGSPLYEAYRAICTTPVKNSKKRFGYYTKYTKPFAGK